MNIKRAQQLQLYESDNVKYYGGNQSWYSSNTSCMGGCGSVAASNALRCLARLNKDVYNHFASYQKMPRAIKNALCHAKPTREDYEILMTDMYSSIKAFEIFPFNKMYDRSTRGHKLYKYLKPSFGQNTIGFIIGIIRFAAKFGLDISIKALPTAFCSRQKGLDFINEGLKEGGCVILLTSYNKHSINLYSGNSTLNETLSNGYTSSMKCHFVTITDIDLDTDRLLITTWGQPATVSINELTKSWQSIKAFESTLLYVSPSTKSDARKTMLKAYRPFLYGIIQTIIRKNIYK